MKLTDAQLRACGKRLLAALEDEHDRDKPFGTDEWPEIFGDVVGREIEWDDVDKIFRALLRRWGKA